MQVCIGKHENVHGRQVMIMKKYTGYLPIGMLCLIILFSQLICMRRNDFHVELSTIAQEGKRIGDPKAIKDLNYSFYIADTNLGGYSGEGNNAWRIDAQGDSFKLSYDPEGYNQRQRTYEDDAEAFCSVNVSPKYDEKTMPMSEEKKQMDAVFDSDEAVAYENKIDRLAYEIVIRRHHVEGDALLSDGEEYKQLFTVKTKNGKRDLTVTYNQESVGGEEHFYVYPQPSIGNADDKYGNLKNYGFLNAPIVKLGEESFTAIGALQFQVNFNEVEFDKDPTGIYRIEENGRVTQIVPMDVKKETVLYMEAFQGNLLAVVEKNGYLYGRAYSSKGVLLDEFPFSFNLQETNRIMLLPEKEHILFVQEAVYAQENRNLLIYGMEQERFKLIDQMTLNGGNITDISGNYANTLLHYKKDTEVLYIVINDDGKSLYVVAQTNKKLLYSSSLLGDYTDDSKLALPDTIQIASGNAYENIMSYVLNTQKRTIQGLRFVEEGAS